MLKEFLILNKSVLIRLFIWIMLIVFILISSVFIFSTDSFPPVTLKEDLIFIFSFSVATPTFLLTITIIRGYFDFYKKRQQYSLLPIQELEKLGFKKEIIYRKYDLSTEVISGIYNGYHITLDCDGDSYNYDLYMSVDVNIKNIDNDLWDKLELDNIYFGIWTIDKLVPKEDVKVANWTKLLDEYTNRLKKEGI